MRHFSSRLWFWVTLLAVSAPLSKLRAQGIVNDALAALPRETVRFEYSNAAKLRGLPNYASLRERYLGKQIKVLAGSLSQLGVRETDVDELVAGWQASSGGEFELGGLAAGRFDPKAVADHAASKGLTPTPVDGTPAYCLGTEAASTCVLVFSPTLGAYGPLPYLTQLVEARAGRVPGLNSNSRFVKLFQEVSREAPIWGAALGPGVGEWFKGWAPNQGQFQMGWSQALQPVEALTYSLDAQDKIHMNATFDCTSPEAAIQVRQLLDGVRIFQQLAWQQQYPNRANPFGAMGLSVDDRQVHAELTAAYEDLVPSNAPAK